MSNPRISHVIHFPEFFDRDELLHATRGYLQGLRVEAEGKDYYLSIYDTGELRLEVVSALRDSAAYLPTSNMIVVEVVDRTHIVAAVNLLAQRRFSGMSSGLGKPSTK